MKRDRTSEDNKIKLKKKFEKYHVPDTDQAVLPVRVVSLLTLGALEDWWRGEVLVGVWEVCGGWGTNWRKERGVDNSPGRRRRGQWQRESDPLPIVG